MASRVEEGRVNPEVGYFKFPGLVARTLVIVYRGVVGELDSEIAQLFAARLLRYVREQAVDILGVNLISADHPLLHALKSLSSRIAGNNNVTLHRGMLLEKEPGFLLRRMRSKHRSWILKKERALESECSAGSVRWRWEVSTDNLQELCGRLESVASTTYQRGLNAGFRASSEQLQRLALFVKRNELRVMSLEIGARPVAYWIGQVYGRRFYSSATGYLPEVAQYEAGTLMFIKMVDELALEGVEYFDFGFGDAHYKKRFGTEVWSEVAIRVFGSTWKGYWLFLVFRVCSGLDAVARRLVLRLGALDFTKRVWRRKLANNETVRR